MLYKLRAECKHDVKQLSCILSQFTITEEKIDECNINGIPIPDVEYTFDVNQTIEEVIEIIKDIPDSHVMYQTIETIDKYTGERKY